MVAARAGATRPPERASSHPPSRQRLVWGLGVRDGGKIDRRSQVSAGIRFSIILLLPAASLWLDSRQAFALIAGFSALPLALMTEGVIQLFSKRRSDSPHGL